MKKEALINELSQHALMAANESRRLHPLEQEKYELAYSRAKTYSEVKCPKCWVEKGQHSPLDIEAKANDSCLYMCKICEFKGVFPKPDH